MYELFEGLEVQTKQCSKCSQVLPVHLFSNASGGKYLRTECNPCDKKLRQAREKAKKTAPSIPENYKCPICLRTEVQVKNRGGKKSGNWCCDHNHITGKFRGWLCHDCNRGIGVLGDNAEILKRALEYISKNDKHS